MSSGKHVLFGLTIALTFLGNHAFDERLKDDLFAIYTHAALIVRNITYEKVDPAKINYYLFTRDNPKEYLRLDPEHASQKLKGTENLVFLIHGWTGSRDDDWYDNLKDTFLASQNEHYKVVQVDWREPADQFYIVSSYNTKEVGQFIGKFIVDVHRTLGVPLAQFLLVGHSLGAQVSGFAGKTVYNLTNERLPRIVALDPAGPLFDMRPDAERLNPTDAKIVHVVHTDGGTFGLKQKCGTIDFYPNGGIDQAGCRTIDLTNITNIGQIGETLDQFWDTVSCDHRRAYEYFVEAATKTEEFIAEKCKNWIQYETGMCEKVHVAMGDVRSSIAAGDYYLTTNSKSPFSLRGGRTLIDRLNPLKHF